jgi:hypothetical protein
MFACDVYLCVPDGRAQNRDTAANPQSRISGDPAGRGEAPLARFGFRLVSSLVPCTPAQPTIITFGSRANFRPSTTPRDDTKR